MTPKIEQALYILKLINEKEQIDFALTEVNFEDIWIDSALSLPNHFHSDIEPNYMEILSGLEGIACREDAPIESVETLIQYLHGKVDEKAKENVEYLKLRLDSVVSNIKYLKTKYKKDWKTSYKETIKEMNSIKPETLEGEIPNESNLDIDSILDKINKNGGGDKGIKSLTESEKKFLRNKGGNNTKQ